MQFAEGYSIDWGDPAKEVHVHGPDEIICSTQLIMKDGNSFKNLLPPPIIAPGKFPKKLAAIATSA